MSESRLGFAVQALVVLPPARRPSPRDWLPFKSSDKLNAVLPVLIMLLKSTAAVPLMLIWPESIHRAHA